LASELLIFIDFPFVISLLLVSGEDLGLVLGHKLGHSACGAPEDCVAFLMVAPPPD